MTLVSETLHKQNHCGNYKAGLNEKPTDSPQWFFIHSSNSVLKTRAIFLFTIKIIEMFELHASMPSMRSAEYQTTIPQNLSQLYIIMQMFKQSTNQNHYPVFMVVVTSLDGINGWSIQTLLTGENDSKQSDEIEATWTTLLHEIFMTR